MGRIAVSHNILTIYFRSSAVTPVAIRDIPTPVEDHHVPRPRGSAGGGNRFGEFRRAVVEVPHMIDKLNGYLLRKQAELEIAQEEGQTMVEYGLVLVAVALVALVAYNALGSRVSTFINSINF
jgi:Flp pilus assembly pilin Flp